MPAFQFREATTREPIDVGADTIAGRQGPLPVTLGGSGASATQVQGNVANNVANAGNPVGIGGLGQDTVPTAVTAGARVWGWFLRVGAMMVGWYHGLNYQDDEVSTRPSLSSVTVHSAAYEISHVLKSSSGKLMSLTIYNSKVGAQFIQLHDAVSLPADTAIPVLTISLATIASATVNFGTLGLDFSTGIVVANSSTGPTLTKGSADCFYCGTVI